MKIAVECKSPLLQKSLEIFLVKYISSAKHSDIIVRDEECLENEKCFYISSDKSADLIKPFSKSQLILALEKRYKKLYKDDFPIVVEENFREEPVDFEILEKRIDYLTKEYQQNILKAVKAFYED